MQDIPPKILTISIVKAGILRWNARPKVCSRLVGLKTHIIPGGCLWFQGFCWWIPVIPFLWISRLKMRKGQIVDVKIKSHLILFITHFPFFMILTCEMNSHLCRFNPNFPAINHVTLTPTNVNMEPRSMALSKFVKKWVSSQIQGLQKTPFHFWRNDPSFPKWLVSKTRFPPHMYSLCIPHVLPMFSPCFRRVFQGFRPQSFPVLRWLPSSERCAVPQRPAPERPAVCPRGPWFLGFFSSAFPWDSMGISPAILVYEVWEVL